MKEVTDQATPPGSDDDAGGGTSWFFGAASLGAAVLAVAALGVAYQDGIRELVHLWNTKEEYSHAPLLPLLSLFLVWQQKNTIVTSRWSGSWSALLVVLLSMLLFFVGTLSTIYAVIQYALCLSLVGLVFSFAGFRNYRTLWAGLVLLFFTIPLPQFLYQGVSTKLQLVSSELGVQVIRAFGVSVFLEGNVIDLGSFKLQVVEACNGLRYLFPLTSFGFLCAYLYRGPLWHKVLLFISTVPITVLMNSLRIGIIGVTVDRWGQDMAEGLLHDFEGWAIFMACLAVLFAEMAVLARLQRPPTTFADAFFVEIPGPAPRTAEQRPRSVPAPFVAAVGLVIATAASTFAIQARQELSPPRQDFADFPMELGAWHGKRELMEKMYIDVLKFTDYVMANYSRGDAARPVNFYVAYYASQRAGESAHSPRSCIPGGGWKIESLSQVAVADVPAPGRNLQVNRVEIAMGEHRQLVYYWFQQRGRVITNEYLVKWYLLWDSITRSRSDGALVRLTTNLPAGASWDKGDEALRDFLGNLGPTLDAYVPR